MKRFAITAALLVALALPAAAAASTPTPTLTGRLVTAVPAVQRDLRLASEFWAIEQPSLLSPCLGDSVLVTQMQDGIGDNGQIVLASDVWAETGLGSCTIDIAPVAWALGRSGNSNTSYMMCILIAHEYGHTLGLPDTESIPMMSSDWARRDDPLCDRAVYGWRWTLHRDREWIAANRKGIRRARREARMRALIVGEQTLAAAGASGAIASAPPPAPAPASQAPTS